MAEFVEVIKQKNRMCSTIRVCVKCRLGIGADNHNMFCTEYMKQYPDEAEGIIMDWAAENPEKTNLEVLKETIKEKFGSEIAEMMIRRIDTTVSDCFGMECKKGCEKEEPCNYCRFHGFWSREYVEPVEG